MRRVGSSKSLAGKFFAFACLLSALGVGAACAAGSDDLAATPNTNPDGGAGTGGVGNGGSGGSVINGDSGTPDANECGTEICGDKLDNDCNGQIDDCPCAGGAQEACYTGATGTENVGVCVGGNRICDAKGEFGTWGPCEGEVVPGAELCDSAKQDEDCDGAANEGCECVTGSDPVACGSNIGECQAGTQTCLDGALGPCTGSVGPVTETCNGLDDDCDGDVDEGVTTSCGTAIGACTQGTSTCTNGQWGACSGGTQPGTETCNNIDDDCDGQVDEGLSQACGSDVGECKGGTQTCSAGSWGTCVGEIKPGTETCNNLDDDCDGLVDESVTKACGSTTGACGAGTSTCTAGVWGTCSGETGPTLEVCNNIDDDCDGTIDEGLTQGCGTDVGVCSPGTQTCSKGSWGTCVGSVGPGTEICNALDDDCDGVVDEGCNCVNGQTQPCGTSTGACTQGTATCNNGQWGSCIGGIQPTSETCNNVDDDCDGQTDEGLTQGCGTNTGACASGTQVCVAGSWGSCQGSIGPTAESCNNIDDDCDGQVDETLIQACGTSTGACTAGTSSCNKGQWGACTGSVGPTTETCNGLDDDCDGATDELLTKACGSDVGACVSGTQSCTSGSWSTCQGSVGPTTETCNNADDDCDGLVDESLTKQCGTTNVGACEYGSQTCSSGVWGSCIGVINPSAEVCANGLDDDCDGGVDEAADCPDLPPTCTCPATKITTQPLQTLTLAASCSDPDGGTITYQWTVTSAPSGSSSKPKTPNAPSTTFFVDLAGTYVITLTAKDDEGNIFTCTTTIESIPPQDLHVELVWDKSYGDADLHLTAAGLNNSWYQIEPDCFFANTSAAWPPAGGAGDATLDIDDTDGYGPENINIFSSPANGTYQIGVAYYCQHSVQKPGKPQIDPGSGPTTATVKVYCGGSLVATYANINLDKTGRFVHVAYVDWPTCSGKSVMTSTWTSLVQPASLSSPAHCTLPCTKTTDCGGGEICSGGVCVLD